MQAPFPPLTKKKSPITNRKLAWLEKPGKILRLSSLSVLFAGSAAIVLAAITLVKAGVAGGLTVSAAAAANAPIFLIFAKVAAGAAALLLLAEAIDSLSNGKFTQSKIIQYIASAACCLCAFHFAFSIAPEMETLLPQIADHASARNSFHALHESSRLFFSGIILFAWLSLILPVFFEKKD